MRYRFFYQTGHKVVEFVDYLGELTLFFLEACRTLPHPPWFFREIIAQMYQLGVRSFSLVAVASFAVGLVLAMQGIIVLTLFGAANYIATSVAFTFFRGMGPLLAGIMLASRGGAGIGAEIGSMRVTNQIDALTVSAINPMKYLVVTRIVACMLVMPLLTIVANLIGILGGMIIGVIQVGMSPTFYYTLTIKYLMLRDVLPGIGMTCRLRHDHRHGGLFPRLYHPTRHLWGWPVHQNLGGGGHPPDPGFRCLPHQTHHHPLPLILKAWGHPS